MGPSSWGSCASQTNSISPDSKLESDLSTWARIARVDCSERAATRLGGEPLPCCRHQRRLRTSSIHSDSWILIAASVPSAAATATF
jgi:hypothetical protein